MTITFDGPTDERPIMERHARMVAHLAGPLWKSAHVILQDALTKPAKPDDLGAALQASLVEMLTLQSLYSFGKVASNPELRLSLNVAIKNATKALDADSARRNAEANKPAFPGGRFAGAAKGGV